MTWAPSRAKIANIDTRAFRVIICVQELWNWSAEDGRWHVERFTLSAPTAFLLQGDMAVSPQQLAQLEQDLVTTLLQAAAATVFGAYYRDADVVLRWREGELLETAEIKINRKARKTAPMPKS